MRATNGGLREWARRRSPPSSPWPSRACVAPSSPPTAVIGVGRRRPRRWRTRGSIGPRCNGWTTRSATSTGWAGAGPGAGSTACCSYGPSASESWVEPALPAALAELTERQRLAVGLVHGYGWTLREVAELCGLRVTTVQNHLERGLAHLRARWRCGRMSDLGDELRDTIDDAAAPITFEEVVNRTRPTTSPDGAALAHDRSGRGRGRRAGRGCVRGDPTR